MVGWEVNERNGKHGWDKKEPQATNSKQISSKSFQN